jgi:hypothetical protein
MATTLIVSIEVEDYAKWKQMFDSAEEMRANMGIKLKGLYRSATDENQVTILSEYPSLEIAQKIISSPIWEENQRKSGVIGGFKTGFFNEIE